MPTDWLRVIAFSCTHHPLADKDTTKWRLSQIREYKPDVVVNLGDWMDADAASRWPNEHEWTLLDEYRAVAQDAKDIAEAAPGARLVWLQGNHDDNLGHPNRIPKKLRDACAWTANADMAEVVKNWKVVPYKHSSYYRIGQVTFQHGCEQTVNADRNQCVAYGVENGLWVGGHTHRPVPITQVVFPSKLPLKRWFANVGCGCDWEKMEYVQRVNILLWGHAVIKLKVNPRRAYYGSLQWEPDPGVIVHKTVHGSL